MKAVIFPGSGGMKYWPCIDCGSGSYGHLPLWKTFKPFLVDRASDSKTLLTKVTTVGNRIFIFKRFSETSLTGWNGEWVYTNRTIYSCQEVNLWTVGWLPWATPLRKLSMWACLNIIHQPVGLLLPGLSLFCIAYFSQQHFVETPGFWVT